MMGWGGRITALVSYNLAVNLHRLWAVYEKTNEPGRLIPFMLETFPWTYPLLTTTKSKSVKELRPDITYWALTGTTLLVPWRLSTSMQGVGKTTAALFFACRPMTREFWRRYDWVSREPPPFETLEDCVNAIVDEGLFINNLDSLIALIAAAKPSGIKYPVVVLDDLSAWASSRDISIWKTLTGLLTTFRSYVGIVIGTAAGLNQVFVDIRRNATLVGEVGQYVAEECSGIRINWVKCVDKTATCSGSRGGREPINLGFGPPTLTMICDEFADRVRNTVGYRKASTVARDVLVTKILQSRP
ncbi:hypothetical protein [Vulcanisaeta distributa]|uniref:hypothetical protein n=1 Tax=Vulcanisaeta distributa TaxID=164451 RepID=UPI0006CF6F03|nr:hypothetical protein [Vulcanisaeta distributa]